MTCSKYHPMLSRLLDRELSPWEAVEVEDHLAQCESCRALLEHWRLQGARLRDHLCGHALGEDFVRKVAQVETQRRREASHASTGAVRRRGLVRWLPAAAAVIAAIAILSQIFPSREGIGYARVIDPGESLEVLQTSSLAWVRTAAGAILHPGDWLRNPVPGDAEIMWRDFCRLTLEADTLVQIPASPLEPPDQVILLSGSLLTDVQAGKQAFQVRTPAGAVMASLGQFTVRVCDVMLPKLEVSADRSETLSGMVLPIGEVSVDKGAVTVWAANAVRKVLAGETAAFSQSQFADAPTQTSSVEASLSITHDSSEKGALFSSVTATAEGLRLDFQATNISLKKLLECATGTTMRGGEDISVAGSLKFLANSSPESVASAVGVRLGLPISFRREKVRAAIASITQNQAPASGWIKGDFTFEKSSDGLISFDFRGVPAGRAFRILRSAVTDLPELSTETEWLPITLQASALNPREAAAFVGKALGLRFRVADNKVGVIEIEGATAVSPTGEGAVPAAPPFSLLQPSPMIINQDAHASSAIDGLFPPAAMPGSVTDEFAHASQAQPLNQAVWPAWNDLGGGANPAGFYPSAIPMSNSPSSLKATASRKTREFFGAPEAATKPAPSLHLIWPALDVEDATEGGAAYLVMNPMGLPAHTLWNGYDREGQLVAQYAVVIGESSTLALLPPRDLPASVGEGGHWEAFSDIPVIGSRDTGSSGALVLGLPVESERLPHDWSFPAWWLGELGGHLWFVNPGEARATIVLTVTLGGSVVSMEQLTIPAHGGLVWPEWFSGMVFQPDWAASGRVIAHALQGSVAAGLAK
jgi:hypothetical protein